MENDFKFDLLKNEESDKIAESANLFSAKYLNIIDNFIQVIEHGIGLFKINEELDKTKLLQSIHLSLVFASASSSFLNVYLKEEYTLKIEKTAKFLNVNMNEIIFLTRFEGEFLKILGK